MVGVFVFILILFILIFWINYSLLVLWSYKKTPFLSRFKSDRLFPLISIILPTRSEGKRVSKCIHSINSQSYPNLELIVVDDSRDDTVGVINRLINRNFRIVKQEPLPADWIGKHHALQQGREFARGEWLLFIDADTSFESELLERLMTYAMVNNLDLVSLLPKIRCESFLERVIQPIPLSLLLCFCPPALINSPKSKVAAAFGPFILVKREVFDRVEGYSKIRDRIADDVELAKLLKISGFRIAMVNALDMAEVRMYSNFREMWEGWSKNLYWGVIDYLEIRSRMMQVLLCIAGFALLLGIFSFLPFAALLSIFLGKLEYASVFFLSYLAVTSLQAGIHRVHRGYPLYTLLSPIGGAVIAVIFLASAFKTLGKRGVRWKGRRYFYKKIRR